MSVIHVDKNNINDILSSEKRVLLDFYADWCGPCQMVAPFINQIAEENPQYVIGKINVDEQPELAAQYDVAGIPSFVVIENGQIINKASGARPKNQILSLLEG